MKKQLPNILTCLRFPLSLAMLLPAALSPAFFILYLLCCLTDVLDGFAARRLDACSETGARLDSAADFLLVIVLVCKLWPVIQPGTGLTVCIIAVAAVRFGAALTARVRFGRAGFLHTYGNKATGVLLAMYPPVLLLTQSLWVLCVILLVAGLSAAEELAIECTASVWNADRQTIFIKEESV